MNLQVAVDKGAKQRFSSPTDQRLLQACRSGDEQAWLHLLEKYEHLVYSIPLSYGLSREDAADIAQIVFMALIQSLDTLRDDSNLGGWLALVTRRHTWRVCQRRRREAVVDLDDEIMSTLFPSRTNEIERWEVVEWLHRGLILISSRCRELLTALYFESDKPSYAQIAQRFGIAEGSIGPTRARCLQRLHEILTR